LFFVSRSLPVCLSSEVLFIASLPAFVRLYVSFPPTPLRPPRRAAAHRRCLSACLPAFAVAAGRRESFFWV
jgi:hypothetical protein